jgi:hypothetical protein
MGGQARGDRGRQILQPGPSAGDGGERRELRRPGHDFQDHLGQLDAGQHGGGAGTQVHQRRGLLDGLHPGQVDLPGVIDADLGIDGQPPADLPVGGVQRLRVPGQQRVRVGGQGEGGQHVAADSRPHVALQEPGLRVAPPGRGLGVDVAALEAPPELLQHAEGVGVPANRAALVSGVAEDEPPPRPGHHAVIDEPSGDERGGQAAAVGQHVGQRPHRGQHGRALGCRAERDHGR